MKLAQVYFRQSDFARAETEFGTLGHTKPESDYTETALFLAGQCALKLSAVDRALLDECGVVVEQTPVQIKLKVKRERVIAVCKRLLDVLPVTDIDIQEVPIEDIIRQLFARERGTVA